MAARIDLPVAGAVPRAALLGAVALIMTALALAAVARRTDLGATRNPTAAVAAAVDVNFADGSDGAVIVTRSVDGARVGVLAPGTNGFMRAAVRGLVRERRRAGFGAETPFTLTRWSDGRLSLSDAATGRHIELDAFGPDNAAVFARLLVAGTAR
jgi:putative photosynthetic complex assembly protein